MQLSGITLHKLRLFTLVYDLGSVNKAAHHLNMSQSAVSQHIKGLEAAVGTSLFDRSPQGVRPTPDGHFVYDHAVAVLAQVDQMAAAIVQRTAQPPQTLILAATPGASVYVIPHWLAEFQLHQPNVTVTTHTGLTQAMVRSIVDGAADFGVTLGAVDDLLGSDLAQQLLWHVDYVVVVPPDHRWAQRDSVTMADLRDAPFLARQQGSRSRRWLEAAVGRLHVIAEMDSPFTIKHAVLNGVGISVLPSYVVEREVQSGELVTLTVSDVMLRRSLILLWRSSRPFSQAQAAFLKMLAADNPEQHQRNL